MIDEIKAKTNSSVRLICETLLLPRSSYYPAAEPTSSLSDLGQRHLMIDLLCSAGMAAKFVNIDHETPLLLPPDLRDWVEPDHMVHFIMMGSSPVIRGVLHQYQIPRIAKIPA